ncbi:MAG: UDP-N-acetylglucosamine--N-acetylmuramyl-(pentapeptide) pyrophosphoryl-undecaprenol N-acetylglucosamine transferase [Bacilli bacterium]|nr:UDP-N-acetylglucosamine--N-acetylmuramyl-(pentapeptide) pyrophosphoryl-undecaprenol N-acetylglucosamine transferase [Bacilli bacterium]
MNIVFCGGGTLGHIYPALALINKYKQKYPNDKVIFITNHKDQKRFETIDTINIDKIYYFNCMGKSKSIIKNIKMIFKNLREQIKIKKLLKQEHIEVVIGMGGYISGITIKTAQRLKLKTIIHEQNSIIGLANKLVAKKADMLLTTFPLPNYTKNQYVVGNPRYYDAEEYSKNEYRSSKNILITSGTIGSEAINNLAIEFLNSDFSKNYTTTLITGVKYYDKVKAELKDGTHYEVLAYSNKMLELMSKAGIIISRSGSTTIFEILGSKAIPILIPSPNVTANHQYFNAQYLESLGIGILIRERELTLDKIITSIQEIDNNYNEYLDNLSIYSPPATFDEIVEHILKFRKP